MSKIFISYAHDDGAFVNHLANELLDKGYEVWVDILNLPGGTTWETDIFEAIESVDVMLVIWSGNVEGSEFTKREVTHALDKGKKVIPLVISGDADRMWSNLKAVQWIDFREDKQPYATAMQKLQADVPLPEDVTPPPQIGDLIQRADTKFNSAARLFRSKLTYGKGDDDAVGLLLKRHPLGLQSFLVGRRADTISAKEDIQVFFNMSRLVEQDSFRDYLTYMNAAGRDLNTVLIRGPIVNTPRGLSLWMPNNRDVYEKAVSMAWSGVGKIADEYVSMHLYINGPVALAASFTAADNIRRPLYIYQLDRVWLLWILKKIERQRKTRDDNVCQQSSGRNHVFRYKYSGKHPITSCKAG